MNYLNTTIIHYTVKGYIEEVFKAISYSFFEIAQRAFKFTWNINMGL